MGESVTTRTGDVLSSEEVDRLAERAERGFDLARWGPRRGRPGLDPGTGQESPRVTVRVPEATRRRAADRAKREGTTLSKVVRSLLDTYAQEG